jgi:hypothetical protein
VSFFCECDPWVMCNPCMSERVECRECGNGYGRDTEQAVCIEETGRCIPCALPNLAPRDTQRFHDEALARRVT